MAPLLVLNGDEIVEASLLSLIGRECRTSPTPEEEAALLGDIKHKIEPSQVPEPLEVCEQVQSAEQTAAPTASHPSPSFLTRSSPFPEGKEVPGKSNQCRCNQWVKAYLEENDRVPKWWREFQCLLWYPSDSLIQNLAHKQVTAFWLPTVQLEKDGW